MSVFADTSALYALLVHTEEGHREVAGCFREIVEEQRPLATSNYVLLETTALLQRRIGLPAVLDLWGRLVPLFTVHWIDESIHRRALERLARADRRDLSLVDCSSFELMQREGMEAALALDQDFAREGFRLLP